jgi:hypothetical protein
MSRQGGLRTCPYPDPTIRHSPFAIRRLSPLATRRSPLAARRLSPFTIRYSQFAIRRFFRALHSGFVLDKEEVDHGASPNHSRSV